MSLTKEAIDLLYTPIPKSEIHVKRERNCELAYISVGTALSRMDAAFPLCWSSDFTILDCVKDGNMWYATAKVTVVVRINGQVIKRSNVGGAGNPKRDVAVKGSVSDAMKRVAHDFGVGRDLRGDAGPSVIMEWDEAEADVLSQPPLVQHQSQATTPPSPAAPKPATEKPAPKAAPKPKEKLVYSDEGARVTRIQPHEKAPTAMVKNFVEWYKSVGIPRPMAGLASLLNAAVAAEYVTDAAYQKALAEIKEQNNDAAFGFAAMLSESWPEWTDSKLEQIKSKQVQDDRVKQAATNARSNTSVPH